jgi:hypothetical protein
MIFCLYVSRAIYIWICSEQKQHGYRIIYSHDDQHPTQYSSRYLSFWQSSDNDTTNMNFNIYSEYMTLDDKVLNLLHIYI